MNVYKITGQDGEISYTAASSLFQVAKGKNDEFKQAVIKVEEIESGLDYWQIEHHKLPMDIVS